MPTHKTRETPAALQAWEDYWAMGDGRSLRKLMATYVARRENGEDVPAAHFAILGKWSAQHDWQGRVEDRIREEAERVREENRRRVSRYRRRLMDAIEADTSLYAKRVAEGKAVLAEDAPSLERMAKLFFQLAEEPLAEKIHAEHTGPGGGAMQVQTSGTVVNLDAAGADPALADALADFARAYAGRQGDAARSRRGADSTSRAADGDPASSGPAEPPPA